MKEILISNYNLENVSTNFKSLVALDSNRVLGYKNGIIYLYNIKKNTFQKIRYE